MSSIGTKRALIAPTLTGEDLAEMLALADFCISCGGSLTFNKPGTVMARLIGLKLAERVKQTAPGVVISRNGYVHRLTKLGWLTLLTRAEAEMQHLLPPEPEGDDE